MNRIPALALLTLLSVTPLFGQTNQPDSQTLQQILVEIRGWHNDFRLNTTTQILLTEYQLQQGVVTRATQHRDDLRSKLTQIQSNLKMYTTQITQNEDKADKTFDPAEKQQLAGMAANVKSFLESMKKQEQDTTSDLQDAESALAKEQNMLSGIQARLDDVVKQLQPINAPEPPLPASK
jgi:chromosome segregation ATPase